MDRIDDPRKAGKVAEADINALKSAQMLRWRCGAAETRSPPSRVDRDGLKARGHP